MQSVTDETVDRQVVEALATDYDIHDIAPAGPGARDAVVLNTARSRGAILVTADEDFSELVFRQHSRHFTEHKNTK